MPAWGAVGGFAVPIALVSIMLAIGGIILGLGYALNDDRLKEFGKNEAYQSVVNAALVGSLLLLFVNGGVVSSLINQVMQSNGAAAGCQGALAQSGAICFAYGYLAGGPIAYNGTLSVSVATNVEHILGTLYEENGVLGLASAVPGIAQAFAPLLTSIKGAIEALTGVLIGIEMQAAVLTIIAYGALTLVLPVGLTLRTFYPTRKLGGFFMGLAIGLYVVFPLSYVLNAALSQPLHATLDGSGVTSAFTAFGNQVAAPLPLNWFNQTNDTSGLWKALDYTISSAAVLTPLRIVTPIVGLAIAVMDDGQSIINALAQYVAVLVVYAIVLPAFSLLITWVSVRELSHLFGADINLPMFRLV